MTVGELITELSQFDKALLVAGHDDCGHPEELEVVYHTAEGSTFHQEHVEIQVHRAGWYESEC